MFQGIYTSVAGALVEEVRQDVIANNLANINTTAFKSGTAVFRERLAEALEDLHVDHEANSLLDRVGGGVFLDEVAYSRRNGPLEPSSNDYDFALQGDGFFVVGDGDQKFYTRDGRFRRSNDGFLTTADGRFRVLDAGGKPVALEEGKLRVGEDGAMIVEGKRVGKLGLVGALDSVKYQKFGNNLYRFMGDETEVSAATPRVRQNFLERSDAQPVREMVRLIQSQRAYETNMRMIRIQDGTLDQAVNRISQVS